MKTDFLTAQYIRNHPVDAARLLEALPDNRTQALLTSLPAELVAGLLEHFQPVQAARLVQALEVKLACEAVQLMPFAKVVRILRHVDRQARQALEKRLPTALVVRLHTQLQYAQRSVGAIMHPPQPVLPLNITVGEAIKRVTNGVGGEGSLFYVQDDAHKFRGVLRLDQLLRADNDASLGSLRPQPMPVLSVQENLAVAIGHLAWLDHVQLPVTDKDGVLLGMVSYSELHRATDGGEASTAQEVSTPLSLLEHSWLALLQLSSLTLQRKRRNLIARQGEES